MSRRSTGHGNGANTGCGGDSHPEIVLWLIADRIGVYTFGVNVRRRRGPNIGGSGIPTVIPVETENQAGVIEVRWRASSPWTASCGFQEARQQGRSRFLWGLPARF